MSIALFDLDDTLLAGDSNHVWGNFLIAGGVLDGPGHRARRSRYDRQYRGGAIDFRAYLEFTLAPLRGRTPAEVGAWQREIATSHAPQAIFPAAHELLARHREAGHVLVLISATARIFVAPFAQLLGVDATLASEAELENGHYTGRVSGEPCFREGKVRHFERWLRANARQGQAAWFYSDSANDLPLLESVTHPGAVNPDRRLRETASARGWPVLDFEPPAGR